MLIQSRILQELRLEKVELHDLECKRVRIDAEPDSAAKNRMPDSIDERIVELHASRKNFCMKSRSLFRGMMLLFSIPPKTWNLIPKLVLSGITDVEIDDSLRKPGKSAIADWVNKPGL